eukprot:SAG22_NODE_962_length_6280_cov_4.343472_6_plen_59_part_00
MLQKAEELEKKQQKDAQVAAAQQKIKAKRKQMVMQVRVVTSRMSRRGRRRSRRSRAGG